MGSALRLILRLFIVPLAILAAVMAAALVAGIANWTKFSAQVASDVNDAPAFLLAAVFVITVRSAAVALMLLPGLIGVVVSEALAIRNIIVHALNGGLSIWIDWTTMGADQNLLVFDDPKTVIGAGIAAGFAYWVVAGWSAGFWKPVFGNNAMQAGAHLRP
jgi:hypothetical protein